MAVKKLRDNSAECENSFDSNAVKEKLDHSYDFHLFNKNCEYFLTKRRYGTGFSQQTLAVKSIIPNINTVGPLLTRMASISRTLCTLWRRHSKR